MYRPTRSAAIRILHQRVEDKHRAWLCALAREVNTVFGLRNALSLKVSERERYLNVGSIPSIGAIHAAIFDGDVKECFLWSVI